MLSSGAALLLATGLLVPLAAPAAADPGSACDAVGADVVSAESDLPSRPLQLLGVPRATELLEQRGITPGEGVGVAVIDSGVAPAARERMDVVAPRSWASGDHDSAHGTTVAGLVAGRPREDGKPIGVAPGARIVDLRVYTAPDDSDTGGIPSGEVVSALRWLARNAADLEVGVAVMAFDLGGDAPGLKRAVRRLVAADVVVVGAGGNRVDGTGEPAPPGEDARGTVYPAAYDEEVLAVGATGTGFTDDASTSVLLNSDIDVAVPTHQAVSVARNGRACYVEGVATSWAAGLAAGVVALARSAHPDLDAAQIQARLIRTADGSPEAQTRATGAGVLQPVEALTRRSGGDDDGDGLVHADSGAGRAEAPTDPVDPVAGVLADARWWGLLGGGLLVVALVLRPLLARRRS
ncbi:S8 family serine peptidase [Nocardioides coralli]|uniref:S8 family serine peptidase n=1 Tax=Nocardioides coralli TaxID=2872154 RepID=UPI001CA3FF54|nr:S8 family serine peptidase [Nocardioides coralli]QZY29335.1 S8 family serine peptidase [Nocardioides coralli]